MYIQTVNDTYPVTLREIRLAYPSTAFPPSPSDASLLAFNYANVSETARPAYNELTQKIVEGTPLIDAGTYMQVWNVVALDATELANLKIFEKNKRLFEIKISFEADADTDVLSGIYVWNGGYDSATKINNKAEALLFIGDATGTIYDNDNTARTMTPTEMKQVAYDISVDYEISFARYQTAKNAVVACNDDIACIIAVAY